MCAFGHIATTFGFSHSSKCITGGILSLEISFLFPLSTALSEQFFLNEQYWRPNHNNGEVCSSGWYKYKIIKEVGDGTFRTIWRAINKQTVFWFTVIVCTVDIIMLISSQPSWISEDIKRALEEQYGGEEELSQTNPGFKNSPFKFTKYSNAYMLVYIRECDKKKIICNVDEKDITEHLRQIPDKVEEKEQKRKEKAETHLYTIIRVARDEDLLE
ncbi:unnamed protein product [Camellia sinensis]